MKRVYFDYAASTPVDPEVERAMRPYFGKIFANPHALHRPGQEASAAVFAARRRIAEALGADYRELIFTGSATEANNLAIRGAVTVAPFSRPRVVISSIEHESVLETCRALERDGAEVVRVPVARDGLVDLKKLASAIDKRTVLVSVMHANNEIGVVQPIEKIAAIVKNRRASGSVYPLFHIDAVQSFQYLGCRPEALGVDLMTLSAHKIYGPKGAGLLYFRGLPSRRELLKPIITGSGQEFGFRSGTDNVPYIVGFAKAVEIAERLREKESRRVRGLRDHFWRSLKAEAGTGRAVLNGSPTERLPNNLNIYFPGHAAHDLLIKLDLAGIAASPGAACSTRVSRSSFVLEEMGFPEERASGSIRFSLGRQTKKSDIDYAVKSLYNLLN